MASIRSMRSSSSRPLSSDGHDGDAGKVISQCSSGAVMPSTPVDGSYCLTKALAVKLAIIGRMPIRPLVLFKQSYDLPLARRCHHCVQMCDVIRQAGRGLCNVASFVRSCCITTMLPL